MSKLNANGSDNSNDIHIDLNDNCNIDNSNYIFFNCNKKE
jgi:hypothetical protein